jgi:tetratricopeptide (TPR) repeat protein
MIKLLKFSLLLCFISVVSSGIAKAEIINQENLKTHIRWNLMVPKEQFYVVKRDQTINIETVNLEIFQKLSSELSSMKLDSQYFGELKISKENYPAKPLTISVQLSDSSIELFSFYRDVDKKYILDFWINKDSKTDIQINKTINQLKPLPLPLDKVKEKKSPPITISKSLISGDSSILPVLDASGVASGQPPVNPEYRDFRYGSSFIWDYYPMIPQLEKDINLNAKIPDYLYPIRDRENLDDPKEAHMQLSINFYKDGNWGLMNKSITLYEKKYGNDSNHIMNQFLKVNVLLKGNLAKPNRGITISAMTLLANIKDMTKDYDLKSSCLRYLIQHFVNNKDYIRTLELAKELYVESSGEFHHELTSHAALVMLHSLAELRQVDKIDVFLKENKKVEKLLPPQMSMAYLSFAMLSRGETKDLISRYRSVEKSLAKPIHPAILFNLGESLFREAKFEEAVKVFDEFLSTYSYLLLAPHARLRLALSYEILDRSAGENLILYKNAIDRSTSPEIRYEAKLRYVGMRLLRRYQMSSDDKDIQIFLEQSPDEARVMNQDLKKLLWLVRLRLFIVMKQYDDALTYLSSIPLELLKPSERKVFEGDGAEIVYGIIQDSYLKEDYSKVVKIWETFKDKYETKVAKNVYMNFVVCDSFMKLGLYKSYDRALVSFKNALNEEERTYPVWIDRLKKTNLSQMMEEINLIRLLAGSEWIQAEAKLASYPVSLRDSLNYPYYLGLVNFHQKKYPEAVAQFEKVLIKQNPQNQLTPRQTADLLMGYVDSLYRMKNQDHFKTIVKALSEDISRSTSAPILNISERITYLLIESYAGDINTDWKELETMTKSFREKFQKSPYSARIGYLYGLSLIKNDKVPEGREVFMLLTNDKEVPSHIKEMCRSELATLELVEKKL